MPANAGDAGSAPGQEDPLEKDWATEHTQAALEPIIIGASHLKASPLGLSNNSCVVPQPSVSFMSAGVEGSKILIKPLSGILKSLQ